MIRSSKVNAKDANGRTELHNAAMRGQAGFAKDLMEAGADVHIKDHWGWTPLNYAALSGDTDIIEALIAKGAELNNPDDNNALPIHYAVMANRRRACELLIKKNSRVDIRDVYGETVLDWAAANGRPDMLAPFAAIEEQPGVNLPDMINNSPLHRAAYRGHTMVMEILLGKGAQPEAPDKDGRTPLHWAAMGGKKQAVELLMAKGSQVNARDNTGRTPLHEAALNGHNEVVDFLLEKGADINARDNAGKTPLYFALYYENPGTARLLTDKGARIDEKPDLSLPLKKELIEKEAILWHLGHCGWAIKTKNHLLIFDYWQKTPRPPHAGLAKGFINPAEIKDLDVSVLVTHSHSDHYDPVIFQWEPEVAKIQYIFGWDAKKGRKYIYLKKPRAKENLKGMNVFTIYCHHDDVPEVAYLVMVDGLTILHSGDYTGALNSYKDDIDYLAKKSDGVDIAFLGTTCKTGWYIIERLMPKAAFPTHFGESEFLYKGIARNFGSKYPQTTFIAPENKGDRYHYRNGEIKQLL